MIFDDHGVFKKQNFYYFPGVNFYNQIDITIFRISLQLLVLLHEVYLDNTKTNTYYSNKFYSFEKTNFNLILFPKITSGQKDFKRSLFF